MSFDESTIIGYGLRSVENLEIRVRMEVCSPYLRGGSSKKGN